MASGDKTAAIRRQARRRKDAATLTALASQDAARALEFHREAYLALDGDRADILSPIRWTAIALWCKFYSLTEYEAGELMAVIAIADRIVLEDRAKRAQQKHGNPS